MTSRQQLIALIADDQGAVRRAMNVLATNVFNGDLPVPPGDMRGKPKRGSLPGGKYMFHGIGCAVTHGHTTIDFDFGPDGRADGFDAWRLHLYATQFRKLYPARLLGNPTRDHQHQPTCPHACRLVFPRHLGAMPTRRIHRNVPAASEVGLDDHHIVIEIAHLTGHELADLAVLQRANAPVGFSVAFVVAIKVVKALGLALQVEPAGAPVGAAADAPASATAGAKGIAHLAAVEAFAGRGHGPVVEQPLTGRVRRTVPMDASPDEVPKEEGTHDVEVRAASGELVEGFSARRHVLEADKVVSVGAAAIDFVE